VIDSFPTTAEPAVDDLLTRFPQALRIAAPLGLGKPHRVLNAIYRRIKAEPSRSLTLYTALSLTPPKAKPGLEQRFLGPFAERHFGANFEALDYAVDQRRNALPANVCVEEFYMQSGGLLGSHQAQRDYASINYTHVARAVAKRGIDAMVQKVALSPDGQRLSLSCNPDLTFDLLDEIARLGKPRPLLIGEIDPQLPYIGGTASVDLDFFDHVCRLPDDAAPPFALPRGAVSDADYAIGLYASALVKDGGTLQIGIGTLADALAHGLILRHTRNAEYRALLERLEPGYADSEIVREAGGVEPFERGLYGASEMVNDAFRALREAGILKRRVIDDIEAMQRINAGRPSSADTARLESEGRWLDGAFYLGSKDLYRWLRDMPAEQAHSIGMTRVSHINELYGGYEALEREQRRQPRFFNTCMLMTALGGAASETLEDGRVVSGVGGQYNFVAMAHALHDSRSVLMFRATHGEGTREVSSVHWHYGNQTIPRHLRDVAITEYGVADLRDRSDGECVQAMLQLTDARFQQPIIEAAKRAFKLHDDFVLPPDRTPNTPDKLAERLGEAHRSGLLPDYPLGSDFTEVEQRLVRALVWLKANTAGKLATIRLLASALLSKPKRDEEAMQRMGFTTTSGFSEWVEARLLGHALAMTSRAKQRS